MVEGASASRVGSRLLAHVGLACTCVSNRTLRERQRTLADVTRLKITITSWEVEAHMPAMCQRMLCNDQLKGKG